jgi:hypothetical protein
MPDSEGDSMMIVLVCLVADLALANGANDNSKASQRSWDSARRAAGAKLLIR